MVAGRIEEMKAEVTFAEEYLTELDIPAANIHGDYHYNNILYDDSSGIVLSTNIRLVIPFK